MRILGIETSCDETGVAVVENGHRVLANVIATSKDEHSRYGGVFPEMAARKQLECIVPALQEGLEAQNKARLRQAVEAIQELPKARPISSFSA